MTGGDLEATGTPQHSGEPDAGAFDEAGSSEVEAPEGPTSAVDGTRFAHASEAEMARILDFYAVRWEYEPTTFPILWNLDGDVVESFAPDFYLPELEMFLEMTTLKQRLVRKKNRKLRRLRELYPGIRIKLFYARDFRAMMLKYGRLALAEALSGTPGQVVPERPVAGPPSPSVETPDAPGVDAGVDAVAPAVTPAGVAASARPITTAAAAPAAEVSAAAAAPVGDPLGTPIPRATLRVRPGRRRRRGAVRSITETAAEREAGA